MYSRSRMALFLSTAVVASIAASGSHAQTAERAAQPATLGEVIVTAQRRSENVQNIPISVNALTAAQLQAKGAATAEDLTALAPAVVFNSGLGGGQVTIRGIGGTNSGVDPGNAVYVDGVYQYSPQGNLFYLNAVDRIEILKGPQGTLFGRNAAGGLIQVVTRDPSTQKAFGEAQVGYANYDTVSGNIYLNQPINDNLAVNLAAFAFDQRNGWGRNVATGNPAYLGWAWGLRLKVKWQAPDGKTDVLLSGIYNKDKPVAYGSGTYPAVQTNILGMPPVPGIYNTNSNVDSFRTDEQYTIAGTVHHDFDFARFTSITAYDSVRAPALADASLTPFQLLNVKFAESFRTFSQEFHLESRQPSRMQWMVGFLYLHDNNPGTFDLNFAPPLPIPPTQVISNIKLKSYAFFGQTTYSVTDDTKLTVGLRYTHDNSVLTNLNSPVPVDPKTAKAAKPTWRFALDHKFTPDVLGYVSYNRGFKSGLFNPTAPDHPNAAPEILDAYEVGVKSEAFEHRLRVNAAAFYYKFQDVQVQLFDHATNTAYIDNAGDARSYGLDLDVAAEPMAGLTLTAGLALIDTKFTSSRGAAQCFDVAPSGATTARDCSLVGSQLPFAPKVTGSLGATYKVPSDVGEFELSGNWSYNDGYFSDPTNFAPGKVESFNTLNMSVLWTSPSGNQTASVWGKNLLNEHVVGVWGVGGGLGNIAIGYPLAPLTFGGTVGVKF